MATISSYDSTSISTLFSSLNNGSGTTGFSIGSGNSGLFGINYSDYALIRSGAYSKLLRAYYSDNVSDEVKKAVSNTNKTSTSTSKDSAEVLSRIEDASDETKEAADALLVTGSKSVFQKKSVTDDNGKVTDQYDTEAIYKAVSKFAEGYNNLVTQTSKSESSNITRAAERLQNLTTANKKLLSAVGITINEDQKLEIDEETFKNSDMSSVKSLFNTRGGYGYQVSAQASMIDYYAQNEASKSNTYTSNGGYTYNYSTGELFNTGI